MENIQLNVPLLRRKVSNLTAAARSVGLRPATVSNLCTGKIPIGRAEVKTLVALATLAECSLDDLIIRGEKMEMIETGIKTLDAFAPLTKGGTIGLVARFGMGQLVVLAEMFHRLKKRGFTTVLLVPSGENPEINDITVEVDVQVHSVDEAYEKLVALGKEKDIAFAADRSNVISGDIHQLQERLSNVGVTITTFLIDIKGEAVDEDLPFGPLETLWQFDADLAARRKYPAVNPIYSTSSILEGGYLEQNHLVVQQRAQKLLRRYRELRSLVSVSGIEKLPASEVDTYHRGERLEAYLTQPFYVAEEFTGKKGETVHLRETLDDIRKILDGEKDSISVENLTFIGKI
ncbi:ATP synthase subunit B [Evansella cellulosilytica]|uniref:ATP synthase beta subunit C-terminal domain-containing protein n=1 Tax=Evansella cellulosilytica TaxID=1413 RepID=UPI0005A08994|nr:ATP synthase subunit B [Evansella cellulosilytica]